MHRAGPATVAFITFALDHDHADVLDQVRTNGLQMRQDFRNVAESRFFGLDEMTDGEFRGFTVKFANLVAALRLPLGNLTYDMFKLLLELFDRRLHFRAPGLRPGAELFRGKRLAVAAGARAKPIGVRRMTMSFSAAFSFRR